LLRGLAGGGLRMCCVWAGLHDHSSLQLPSYTCRGQVAVAAGAGQATVGWLKQDDLMQTLCVAVTHLCVYTAETGIYLCVYTAETGIYLCVYTAETGIYFLSHTKVGALMAVADASGHLCCQGTCHALQRLFGSGTFACQPSKASRAGC
jgi:hypothetical protein